MGDDFRNRVVVVTGASRGIGLATLEHFARAGARVVGFARSEPDRTRPPDGEVVFVRGDAADEADVDHLFSIAESRFGACDIVVNCAGMIDPRSVIDTSPADWDRMFAVNVRGTYLSVRRALPSMIARGSGAIVNVSSISGVPGPEKFPGWVSYCASKAAVISMTEALAVDLKGTGVRVNCVSPGAVDTRMWAEASGGAPASMTPAEVAESIAFLASDRSRPMNGQNLCLWSA